MESHVCYNKAVAYSQWKIQVSAKVGAKVRKGVKNI